MFEYLATVDHIVDGDTLDLTIDLGFRTLTRIRVRLHGVDTPEIHGVKKGSEEYKAGWKAREYVRNWLEAHNPVDGDQERWTVYIRSHDGGQPRAGKYGRWLVEVYPATENVKDPPTAGDPWPDPATSLNRALLDAGHAKPYFGGKR